MDVRTASVFSVRFVPVVQTNGLQGNVTNANKATFMLPPRAMHPLAGYDADMGPALTTTARPLDKDNTNGAWGTILGELDGRRVSEGSSRYYFGVVTPTYSSGIAGIGYRRPGHRAGLGQGWGRSGRGPRVGTQLGPAARALRTAPATPTPTTRTPAATIGVYGFDVAAQRLKPPDLSDLMGYCNNEWISDYTYTGVLNYRAAAPRRRRRLRPGDAAVSAGVGTESWTAGRARAGLPDRHPSEPAGPHRALPGRGHGPPTAPGSSA